MAVAAEPACASGARSAWGQAFRNPVAKARSPSVSAVSLPNPNLPRRAAFLKVSRAPAINTNTCCQVGLVNPCLNGSIQVAVHRPTRAVLGRELAGPAVPGALTPYTEAASPSHAGENASNHGAFAVAAEIANVEVIAITGVSSDLNPTSQTSGTA